MEITALSYHRNPLPTKNHFAAPCSDSPQISDRPLIPESVIARLGVVIARKVSILSAKTESRINQNPIESKSEASTAIAKIFFLRSDLLNAIAQLMEVPARSATIT